MVGTSKTFEVWVRRAVGAVQAKGKRGATTVESENFSNFVRAGDIAGKTTNDLVMLEAEIEIRGALNDEIVMAELAE